MSSATPAPEPKPEPKPEDDYSVLFRASSLTTYQECERMFAAKMALDPTTKAGPIFADKGYTFTKRKSEHVGPSIGRALHEGFGNDLQAKLDGYGGTNIEQVAISKFRRLGDIDYDEKTGTTSAEIAEEQIRRVIEVYEPILHTLEPKKIEFNLAVMIDPVKKIKLSGHPDLQLTNNDIIDWKFGKNLGQYIAQLGAYRIMARSLGMEVGKLFVHWGKRATIKKPQPPVEIIPYDVKAAENAAYNLAHAAMESLERFKETGNPWKFKANPNSLLCSKKWCPAHPDNGSGWCDVGRPSKKEDEEEAG